MIHVLDGSLDQVAADWLVVGVYDKGVLTAPAASIDAALGGTISALVTRGDITGKLAETIELLSVSGIAATRVCVVGLGDAATLTRAKLDRALMTVARKLSAKSAVSVAVALPAAPLAGLSEESLAALAAHAFTVGCVGQGLYKAEADRHAFRRITLLVATGALVAARQGAIAGEIIGESTNLTRELVNRHPGELYPETFANRAVEEAQRYGLAYEVLDEPRILAERMGSLHGVARGSVRPPRVVLLRYEGAGAGQPWLALIGKGVTFDSGGLSLKPSDSMKTMKCDMAGAATALGAILAIARLGLKVNVLMAAGLVENMPSGSAFMLGEILTARNGATIEIMNTDAEGRLVLADVLSYVVDQGVDKMIDLATLTGACVVALGEEVTGVFANNDEWSNQLIAAAREAGEDVWPMPMFESFAEQLKCDTADMKNIGTRWGGAITAAKFLEKFVSGKPWIHLDIAGPAFMETSKSHRDGGATGAMLRTLVEVAKRFA